jgi:hypothetical protein
MEALSSLDAALVPLVEPELRVLLKQTRMLPYVDRVATLTQRNWEHSASLLLLADVVNSKRPVQGIHELCSGLYELGARHWSDTVWQDWFADQRFSDRFRLRLLEPGWEFFLTGSRTGKVSIEWQRESLSAAEQLDDQDWIQTDRALRLAIFRESLRQQLAQLGHVRGLCCPFRQRLRVCCGFGACLSDVRT